MEEVHVHEVVLGEEVLVGVPEEKPGAFLEDGPEGDLGDLVLEDGPEGVLGDDPEDVLEDVLGEGGHPGIAREGQHLLLGQRDVCFPVAAGGWQPLTEPVTVVLIVTRCCPPRRRVLPSCSANS